MSIIYPSLLGANPLKLEEIIKQLDPHVQGYHIDIMDNQFVPNLSWGTRTVDAIARTTYHTLWVHLMVNKPEEWVDKLLLPPRSILSFHYEAMGSNVNFIHRIKEKGWLASIAINPDTPVEKIFPLLPLIDQVLIMSVKPGFVGQPPIPDVINKLKPLINYRTTNNLKFRIGMDGGIKLDNIKEIVQDGVDDLAIASGIFDYPNPVEAIKILEAELTA